MQLKLWFSVLYSICSTSSNSYTRLLNISYYKTLFPVAYDYQPETIQYKLFHDRCLPEVEFFEDFNYNNSDLSQNVGKGKKNALFCTC